MDVLTVGGLARRDVAQVGDADLALADVAELRRILQHDRLHRRRGQCCRRCREFAEAHALAAGDVHDLVVLGAHVGIRYAPGQGRRMLQHLPGGCAAKAHRLHEVTDAARTIGVLVAVFGLVAGGLDDLDLGPVGFHFVGHDHRQAGARAGAHFGAVGDDGDGAARVDRDVDVRIPHHAARHAAGAGVVEAFLGHRGAGQELRGHDETTTSDHALEQVAAADVLDDCLGAVAGFHDQASFAATLIAAKIRW